jgi:eukaryotic-like serine/threonine-protein kinase
MPLSRRDRLPTGSSFELLDTIASGGTATLYLGRLKGAGRGGRVAIKRAHPHPPELRSMLEAEAKFAARVRHPNVVEVRRLEDLDGELVLAMQYVEGAALSELLSAEQLPLGPRLAVRIALDVAAGLQAVHDVGIVHRDITPSNILVGIDGVARLTDFGLAEDVGSVALASGAQKGTVAYMAPEYVERGVVDARGDVFSLGVVLWEGLTGERLFAGATEIETINRTMAQRVPPPSSRARGPSPAVDEVVLRALERSPERRFASARALAEALLAVADGNGLVATKAEVGSRVRAVAGKALQERRTLLSGR